MDLNKVVIAIPAHNRANSLERLLKSVANADYPNEEVNLIISLEGGASEKVRRVAYEFSSPKLQTTVLQRPHHFGLRKHILACGDLALECEGVIVLEDDLIVDRYFFHYAVAAMRHYDDEASIAGIALYAHEYNEYAGLPFKPMSNGYSTYSMQVPCSWGQCWTASQWHRFSTWYANADSATVSNTDELPDQVKGWPESSWKKYFAAYLIQTNRYFIYPYHAFSTNCSSPGGTHIASGTDVHQVSFASQTRPPPTFSFSPITAPAVAYDAFMEPCGSDVYYLLGLSRDEVEIDTLAIKDKAIISKKKYVLTSRPVISSLRKYPRSYRPIEHNLQHQIEAGVKSALNLSETSSIIYSQNYQRSLDEYSYYSGIKFGSRRIVRAILKALPSLVFSRLRR